MWITIRAFYYTVDIYLYWDIHLAMVFVLFRQFRWLSFGDFLHERISKCTCMAFKLHFALIHYVYTLYIYQRYLWMREIYWQQLFNKVWVSSRSRFIAITFCLRVIFYIGGYPPKGVILFLFSFQYWICKHSHFKVYIFRLKMSMPWTL